MRTIATAQLTSGRRPPAFFDRWADMATWPQWNTDTEWVRLDGPFRSGATGVTLAGPLAFFWNAVLGKDIAKGLGDDLARLEAAARTAEVPA